MEDMLHHRVIWDSPHQVRKLFVGEHEAEMAQELMNVLPGRVAEFRSYDPMKQEMCLEYVRDMDLRDEAHLLAVIRALLETVEDLHHSGYVHRDVHRSNFAVTDTGIKLYDFESIQHQEACDLNILGHDSIEFDEVPANVKEYLLANDYYALSYALKELCIQNLDLEVPAGVRELISNLQDTPEQGSELVQRWLDEH